MLTDALKLLGPCLSSVLTEHLVTHYGLSPAAARQRVSRGAPQIQRLAHLPFARKARFLYHQDDYASPKYWENLHAAVFATNGPYARALGAVQARGALPVTHFQIACGAPIAQKKQLAANAVLDRMVAAGIFVKQDLPGLGTCVLNKEFYENYRHRENELAINVRSRLIAENILLSCVREWLRRLAMVSFNKVQTRIQTTPRIGTFAWDLTAPSYLTAISTKLKDGTVNPGWVVCDVLLTEDVQRMHVEAFLHKARSLSAFKKVGSTIFILVASSFDSEAFSALRAAGVIPATPASLFGEDVANGFRELNQTLCKAAKGVIEHEKFDRVFTNLGKLEGATGNMRGAFFELLVAEVVRRKAAGEVKLNRVCRGDDGDAEVDVYRVHDGIMAQMIECKGVAPGTFVDDEEVSRWLTTRIPRVRYHLESIRWSGPLPRFELWTSGQLSDSALERVQKTRVANAKKFELIIVDSHDLRAQVKALNDPSLLRIFERHFLPQALA